MLARRTLVTESLPLPIRGPETKKFDFARLRQSGQSKTLRNESLTVQMVSNPSWYAVMALPYLMEFPYECTEQTFNRLVRQRAWPGTSPAPTRRSAASSSNGRARPPWTARWRRTRT